MAREVIRVRNEFYIVGLNVLRRDGEIEIVLLK